MSPALESEIKRLSKEEKLHLVSEIWDELASDPETIQLTSGQKNELEKRYQEYLKNPEEGSPWAEVKERILKSR